jgi:pimeloyl-ACP methyl ester carboxylesterase
MRTLRSTPIRSSRSWAYVLSAAFLVLTFTGCASTNGKSGATAASVPASVPLHDQSAIKSRGYFYVGGSYAGPDNQKVMRGQIYVESLVPHSIRKPFPLVLIHGAAQTATNWMGTPDGRKGWAEFFAENGYVVYMIDQPMRGRSAWHPSDGTTRMFSAQAIESQFTATAELGNWPQAKRHMQWPGEGPGKGKRGDPIFDAFYATQVETVASNADTQKANQQAVAALLDRIGPAVVLTHSQAGPFGWLIADARPNLVKGIVAVEPSGPPFENAVNATGKARPWGLTDVPMTYAPALAKPEDLQLENEKASSPELVGCWMQRAPARQLPHLKNIPVMVLTAEASYHAVYDHCTAKYLSQAGVPTDFIRLEERGIRGNGHMVMIEKNNLEIARLIDQWLVHAVR